MLKIIWPQNTQLENSDFLKIKLEWKRYLKMCSTEKTNFLMCDRVVLKKIVF